MTINPLSLRYLQLFVLAASLSYGSSSDAASIDWNTDLRKAAKESTRTQKPMLVEISATWCGYCKKMKAETFADQQIVKHVNGCFIPVSLDADKDEKLADAIGYDSLPATIVISPKLQVVLRLVGYQTSLQLARDLGRFCKHTEKAPSPTVLNPKKKHVAGKAFAFGKFCLASMLDDQELAKGSEKFASTYNGRQICFASSDHKRRFEANPKSYWPANDGNCPVTAVEQRKTQPGDPRAALIYKKRIYFFAGTTQQTQFEKAPDEYLQKLVSLRQALRSDDRNAR